MNNGFEPKVVAFLCNWCSYAGADKAGASQTPYPHNLHIVRLMCSGRVDPLFILKAFQMGTDGVLVLACHAGDCHYKEGNYRAVQRHRALAALLGQFGIEEDRCRFDYAGASEGDRFVAIVSSMVERLRQLPPLRLAD